MVGLCGAEPLLELDDPEPEELDELDELDDDELDDDELVGDEPDDELDDELDDEDVVGFVVVVPPTCCGATNFTRSPIGILSSPSRHILLAPSLMLSQILYPSGHSPVPWQVREQNPGSAGASAFFTHKP